MERTIDEEHEESMILEIREEDMEEYCVSFMAYVDVKIKANSLEEAKEKAKTFCGEHTDDKNLKYSYVYLAEPCFMTDSFGKEIEI